MTLTLGQLDIPVRDVLLLLGWVGVSVVWMVVSVLKYGGLIPYHAGL